MLKQFIWDVLSLEWFEVVWEVMFHAWVVFTCLGKKFRKLGFIGEIYNMFVFYT